MKIILNLLIACLILFSSNALHLSSSKRRASTEAAAYMKLTSLLGFTNGYKTLQNPPISSSTFYCDLLVNGVSAINIENSTKNKSIEETHSSLYSTTTKTNISTETINSFNNAFELNYSTIQGSLLSNNKVLTNSNIPDQVKGLLFNQEGPKSQLKVDLLNLVTVSNVQQQTMELHFKNEYKIELVVKNYKTFTKSTKNYVHETDIKILTNTITEKKEKRLQELKMSIRNLYSYLEQLEFAIKIKILFLKRENAKTIYETSKKEIETKTNICLESLEEFGNKMNEYQMELVRIFNIIQKLILSLETCNSKLQIIITQLVSLEKSIRDGKEQQKNTLLAKNKEAYTHIFYWLEACHFYRVVITKLVKDVADVEVKFSENKIKKNTSMLKEIFYPIDTNIDFLDK